MDTYLFRELTNGEVILSDRRLPQGHGNVDHVVIATSGVWVIDSKNWEGKIEFKSSGGLLDVDERLMVNGKDYSKLFDEIYAQVIPIATLVDDRSIPIHPAIVFIDGNWGPRATLRILRDNPYRRKNVWITWPKALVAKIKEREVLTAETATELGALLDRELPPM
jgi:hypothetical protein